MQTDVAELQEEERKHRLELENEFIESIMPAIDALIAKHQANASPVGRPSKLCKPVLIAILRKIARGTPKSRAPLAMGISRDTWRDWYEAHAEIEEMAEQARAFCVEQLASEVREGTDIKGNPDWKARAWLLERTDKENFTAPKPDTIVNVNNNSLTVYASPDAQHLAQSLHTQAVAAMLEQKRGFAPISLDPHASAQPVALPAPTVDSPASRRE